MGITIDFGKTCRYGVVAMVALSGLAGMPTGYVSTAHAEQVTETWMGPNPGSWSTGTWDPTIIIAGNPHYPNNGVPSGKTYNVLINNGGHVSLDVNPGIDNLTISAGSSLSIQDNKFLQIAFGENKGVVTNDGILSLNSMGNETRLDVKDAKLTGTGKLAMGNNANNRVLYGANSERLTNDTPHTIEGAGSIGRRYLGSATTFTNLGTVTANQSTPLLLTANIVNSGTLRANGGTLNLHKAVVTNTGGMIQGLGASTVDLTGGSSITGGFLDGNIRISSGGATLTNLTNSGNYTVTNGSNTVIGGAITNDGIMALDSTDEDNTQLLMSNAMLIGTGKLAMSDNAYNRVLYGANSELLTNGSLHTIEGAGSIGRRYLGSATTFTNLGTVTANQSTPLLLTANIVNSGTLQADGGTLNLQYANVTNTDGTIEGLGASTVDLTGGTTISGGLLDGNIRNSSGYTTLTNLTNTGSYTVMNGSTTTINGTITNDGIMALDSTGNVYTRLLMSDAILTGTGRLAMSDNAHNIVLSGLNGERLTNDTFHTIEGSGRIGVNTTFTNLGTVTANQSVPLNLYGTVTNMGTFQAESGSSLVANSLTNIHGTTLIGGTYTIEGTMRLPGAVNTNIATIVLDGTNSQLLTTGGANALDYFYANTAAGNFTIKNGRDLTTTSRNFSNAGDMTFESGSTFQLSTNGPSTYTQSAGGVTTVNGVIEADSIVNNGGTLDGTGTINGSVTSNGGTLAPGNSPGTLTLDGDLTLDGASTTQIEIGGTSIGEYDVLNISGTANLAGSLDISLWDWTDDGINNPFTPTAGDFFDIISAESILGSLTLRNVASLGNALTWRVDYLYADSSPDIVRLSVESTATPTPEPSTLLLFGTGLMSCMGLTKRKKKKAAISQPAV